MRTIASVLCLLAAPLAARAADILRTTEAILALSPSEVESALPVEVEGVLLMVDPEGRYIFHDGRMAIFAGCPDTARPDVNRGDRVRIRGFTMAGLFAPIIAIDTLERLGVGEIPAPIKTNLAGLMRPELNPQWVEVEGIVRCASERADHPNDAVIQLAADELRVPVVISGHSPAAAAKWIDSKVRIRAFCFHETNRRKQLLGARLLVPRAEPVLVLEPAEPNPYALPVRAPSSLLQYSLGAHNETRIRLQGIVIPANSPGTFYLQSGQEGIEVHGTSRSTPPAGTRVDVIGFVGRGKNGPIVEDAEFRLLEHVGTPHPRPISPQEAIEADCTLVEMRGRLENVITETDTVTLVLQADDHRFVARLPREAGEAAPWPLQSQLRLIGICRAEPRPVQRNDFAWISGPFELLVRSGADVVLEKTPPWWTRPESGRLATFALLIAAIASLLLFLRYRAKAKSEALTRLAAEREFNAVLKERSRVAREIHDTLAQGLTSISAQLELAKQSVNGAAPPSALRHIDLARRFVRDSLAEARRSVWALRPQVLERMQLAPALEHIARELTSGTGVEVHLETEGEVAELPPDIEKELLRVGQEALTNAVRHGSPSRIQIELHDLPDQLRLHIADDGRGFDAQLANRSRRSGCGISGMQERVQLLNGRLHLVSRPGTGTEVTVEITKT